MSTDKILLLDSTEKCAGTTLKHFLRLNFPEETFFDLDNGDPPSETWRNYGIDCPVRFPQMSAEDDFDDVFLGYLSRRSQWLADNLSRLDVSCVYGNGLLLPKKTIPEILSNTGKAISLNKFLRDPVNRIISEYEYVRSHADHNLNAIAKRVSLEDYVLADGRPKNRMCTSILGLGSEISGNGALHVLQRSYDFVGFVEHFEASLEKFANMHNLSFDGVAKRRNSSMSTQAPENYSELRKLVEIVDQEDVYLYEHSLEQYGS